MSKFTRVFWMVSGDTFRLARGKLGPCVAFCVAALSSRHPFRGLALTITPHLFQQMVLYSIDLSNAPPGTSLRPLSRLPVHRSDA
jgi:hypothetical protein